MFKELTDEMAYSSGSLLFLRERERERERKRETKIVEFFLLGKTGWNQEKRFSVILLKFESNYLILSFQTFADSDRFRPASSSLLAKL